jgi:peptidoglycan/LPS O-acetylase OafA/YrhL
MIEVERSVPKPAPQMNALTGLRFFAAFAVLSFHYMLPDQWPVKIPQWLVSVVGCGNAGVSLFFMLSGFVLAYANRGWTTTRDATLRFWAKRIARIYPIYFLALLWFAPFFLLHRFASEPPGLAIAKSVTSFVPALLLVQSWFYPRLAPAWNGPAWTLSVEAAFYLLFPLIAVRVRLLSQSHKIALCLGCWLLTALLSLADPLLPGSTPLRYEFFTFNPLIHLPTFISGVALGYHYVQRTASKSGTALAVSGGLAALAIASQSQLLWFHFRFEAAFLPAFGALLYGLALGGWPARILSTRPLVILGESSYALYILQFSVVYTLMWMDQNFAIYDYMQYGRLHSRLSAPAFFVLAVFACMTISVLVCKFYETPLRKVLRQRLFRATAGSSVVHASA